MATFNFTYDLNVTLEQRLAFEMAAHVWASLLQDDVEINLHIAAIDGLNGNEAVGGAVPIFHEVNYGVYQEYLANDATSEQDDSVVDALQEGNTVDVLIDADGDGTSEVVDGNTTIMLTRAQAKALGMEEELLLDNGSTWDRDVLEDPTALDGYIVINNSYDWSYDLTRENDVEAGQLDFLTMALHEIGHSLGFVSGLDGLIESFEMHSGEIRTEGMTALDLLRYSETSVTVDNPDGTVSDLTFGSDVYFSIDGGATAEAEFEEGDEYQASHWQRLQNALGIMDPTLGYQERTDISELDLKAFDVLGWDVDYAALAHGLNLDELYQQAIAAISEDFQVGVESVESALENGDDWYSLARGTWWETFKSQMIDLGYGDWWAAFEAEAAALSPGGWWQELDQQMLELGPGSWWQIFEEYAANLAPGGWWQEFELSPGGWWQEFEAAMLDLSPGGWWQTFEPMMVEQSFGNIWQVFELQMEAIGYGAWWQQFEADLLDSGYTSWWDAFGDAILELGPGGWWQAFEDKVIELYPGGWWQEFEENLVELVPGGWWLNPGGWWQAFELGPGGWWQSIEAQSQVVKSADAARNGIVNEVVETGDQVMTGGSSDDILAGGIGKDLINGKAGDDLLDGKDGDDIILAGKGNDIAYGAGGNDLIFGEEGDDFIAGEDGDDQIFGEAGHDILSGGRGADNISGGEGRDVLKGDTDDDVLDGGSGDDQLSGGSGNDLVIGGTGRDIIIGGDGNDVIYGDDYFVPTEGGTDTDNPNDQSDDQPVIAKSPVTTADEAIAERVFWTRIEAEDMQLWKYKKEKFKDKDIYTDIYKDKGIEASGNEFISTKWKGSATTTFSGSDGTYDLVLGYQDESNGVSDITIMVWDGSKLKDSHKFYLSGATGADTYKISGLELESGDKIVIWGNSDGDDEARIDYLDILTTGSTPSVDENGAPTDGFYTVVSQQKNIIQLEVEQMDLDAGAVVQSGMFASNDQYVSTDPLSSAFNATSLFSGDTGYYDVVVGYYDTDNGAAEISIGIDNKEVDRWYSDQNLGTTLVNSDALTTRTVAQGVYITYQDLIQIGASSNLGDSGNIDYIQFIEVEKPTESTGVTETVEEVTPVEPAPLPDPIRVEAEDMSLSGRYNFENQSFASGDRLIKAGYGGNYTATTNFTGPAGFYKIVIGYYDENDGKSPITVNLDGNQLDSWVFDQDLGSNLATANNLVTRAVGNTVHLETGSQLEIQAYQEGGEYARVDYIEFIAVPEAPLRVEAEDMSLSGQYDFENQSFASGDRLIKTNSTLTASTKFNGPAGTYNIVVGYYDESDGSSPISVSLDGNILDSWAFDQNNLGNNVAGTNNFVTYTLPDAVTLDAGSILELQASKEGSEFARIDYIEFIAVPETPEVISETDDGNGEANETGSNNDVIRGGDGDDIAYGGEGDDTIYGDAGDDTLYGDTDVSVQSVAPVPTQTFTPTTLTFQQGVNGYQGTADTYIDEYYGSQATGLGSASVFGADSDYGGYELQGLLKFDDIFGSAASQIGSNDVVTSAILEIEVSNAGDRLMLFDMMQNWSESATWGFFSGNGIQANGIEAASAPTAILGNSADSYNVLNILDNLVGSDDISTGTLRIDVTSSLQAWQADPTQNFGWAFLPTGTDTVVIYSSESSNAPRLTVDINQSVSPPIVDSSASSTTLTFQQGVGGYNGIIDTYIESAYATHKKDHLTKLRIENSDANVIQSLIRFEDIFGDTANQISNSDVISSAILEFDVESGSDSLEIYELFRNWTGNDTWDSLVNGIQTDGIEASSTMLTSTGFVSSSNKLQIDVTASLQAWQADPTQNFGWLMHSTGSDRVTLSSSEDGVNLAPRLIVDLNQSTNINTNTNTDTTVLPDGIVHNGSLYLLTDSAMSWTAAQAYAESLGGNLVTINDAAEETWIKSTFGTSEQFWIGLSDAETEGTWKWASGEIGDYIVGQDNNGIYTNWHPNEPNNDGNQDFATMNFGGSSQWDDTESTSHRGLIEIKLPSGESLSESSNDNLIGGAGNDNLFGGAGNDILLGTDEVSVGIGEIDTLTGGADADIFVLGDTNSAYYSQGGDSDHAVITDFQVGVDVINLFGSFSDYALVSDNSDKLLYWQGEDLIARFTGVSDLTLSDANFQVSEVSILDIQLTSFLDNLRSSSLSLVT